MLFNMFKVDIENEDLRVFSITELEKATNDFRKDRKVDGEDGFVRTFYKGSIDDTSSRTKTRISVSVMECVQDSLEAIEAWKVSKDCPLFTLVSILIKVICRKR